VSSTNLNLASKESSTKPTLTVTSGSAPVDNPPTMPTLNVPSVSGNSVALTWTASTDDIGVAGYNVRRDGALVNPTPVVATNYTDPGVAAGTHSYTVSALDTAGQESGPSTPQSVTILTGNPAPIPATADDYVGSTDTKNNGKSPLLRTTTTNAVNSYLRFPVGGLSGPITSATLKIWANSSLAAGFDIHTVADNWTETGLLPSNLPAIGTGVPVPSGPVTAGAWVSVDVTSLVTVTSGNMDFALTGRSTTNLSLASLDAPANKPQLILTTG